MTHRTAALINSTESLTTIADGINIPTADLKKTDGKPGVDRITPPAISCIRFRKPRGDLGSDLKVRQILKIFGSTSINAYRARDESGAESFQSRASGTPAQDPINNAAMRKALESESNRLTVSSRPAQVRAISGTTALALAILFVMAALGAVFLVLQ